MPQNHLFLSQADFQELLKILKSIPCKVYIYGSRARGDFKEFSDIDLFIEKDIPEAALANLREAFEASDLPVKVDLLMPHQCSADFFKLIKQDMKLIKDETVFHKKID